MKTPFPSEVDVLVIGLGPAGSSAARTCAEAGLKVLAVDRRQEIGSPVQCGEGLSRSSKERMGIELDPRCVARVITGASVYAPNQKSIRLDYEGPEGWILERKIFDKVLAEEASRAGARVFARTDVKGLIKEKGKVCGARLVYGKKEFEVRAKIVIAADGVGSLMAREAGIDTALKLVDICTCAEYEMANVDIDPDRIEFFFDQERFRGGYAWIFPKGKNRANVGLGIRQPFTSRKAVECLDDFVESRPGLRKGSILEVKGGGVPVGGFLDTMVADNFMAVGDAARHVNPIHGGGIAESYIGARIAAQVAVEAIREGDTSAKFLRKYDKLWNEERGRHLKGVLKLRQVVEAMDNDDLNWLAEKLQGQTLVEVSRARGFTLLAKILMQKPKLALLARKLL